MRVRSCPSQEVVGKCPFLNTSQEGNDWRDLLLYQKCFGLARSLNFFFPLHKQDFSAFSTEPGILLLCPFTCTPEGCSHIGNELQIMIDIHVTSTISERSLSPLYSNPHLLFLPPTSFRGFIRSKAVVCIESPALHLAARPLLWWLPSSSLSSSPPPPPFLNKLFSARFSNWQDTLLFA